MTNYEDLLRRQNINIPYDKVDPNLNNSYLVRNKKNNHTYIILLKEKYGYNIFSIQPKCMVYVRVILGQKDNILLNIEEGEIQLIRETRIIDEYEIITGLGKYSSAYHIYIMDKNILTPYKNIIFNPHKPKQGDIKENFKSGVVR